MDNETRIYLDRLLCLVEAVQAEQKAIKAMLERQQGNAAVTFIGPTSACICMAFDAGTAGGGITVNPQCPQHGHVYRVSASDWPAHERQGYVRLSNKEERP